MAARKSQREVFQETVSEFEAELEDCPTFSVSASTYMKGVDGLPDRLKRIAYQVAETIEAEFNCDLSHSELSSAFYTALQNLGRLVITRGR